MEPSVPMHSSYKSSQGCLWSGECLNLVKPDLPSGHGVGHGVHRHLGAAALADVFQDELFGLEGVHDDRVQAPEAMFQLDLAREGVVGRIELDVDGVCRKDNKTLFLKTGYSIVSVHFAELC